MAVTPVTQYSSLTPTVMNNLKTAVKNECLRRCFYGSVESYGGSSYNYTTAAAAGKKITVDYYNKNAVPLNAIDNNTLSTSQGLPISSVGVNVLINKVNTLVQKELGAQTLTATGCAALCTGLCFNNCGTTCSVECQGSCGGACNRGCGAGCAITGTECAGTCFVACAQNSQGVTICEPCYSLCTNTCHLTCSTNCGNSTCTKSCGPGNCQQVCTGTCNDWCGDCTAVCASGCSNTCTGSCDNTCTGTCSTTCTGTES